MIDADPEDGDLAQARHRIRVLEREHRELQQTLADTKTARDFALEKRLEAEFALASSHRAVEELRRDRTRLEAEVQRQQRATRRSVEAEREECAAVAESCPVPHPLHIAATIRSRGKGGPA